MKMLAPIAAMALIGMVTSSGAALSPARKCSAVKVKATAKAFSCVVEAENDAIRGTGSGNVASCLEKLAGAFARAESSGACAVTGDSAAASQLVSDAEAAVLDALGADALPDDQKNCAMKLNRAVGRFAVCRAGRWARALAGGDAPIGDPADLTGNAELCGGAFLHRFFPLIYEHGPCPPINYAGDMLDLINPVQAYLPGADFSGLDLSNVQLIGAVLTGANLQNTKARYVRFRGAQLTGAQVDGADFTGSNFAATDLSGLQLSSVQLSRVAGVGLIGCPASLPVGWICLNQNLVGPEAELLDVDLSGADLSGMNLYGIYLAQSTLIGTNFSGTNLSDAVLQSADLVNANLSGSNLAGANLQYADLTGATLASADMTGVELYQADLDPVASWNLTTCADGTASTANGGTCCGHHVGYAPSACGP